MKISDLTKADQARLEEAQAMVDRQQQALDAIKGPMQKIHNGQALTKRESVALIEVLRWTPDEFKDFTDSSKEERQAVLDHLFSTPYAYFYVGKGAEQVQVYVESGKSAEIRDQEHPGF